MAEALYRKYRPQVFEDVVGQEPIERTLKNAIAQDKVSHAYLFCGPRGTGKTTTARLLAKALLCASGPTPDPDGTCEDCRLIADGVHPDVYELDAASRTGVENVREEIISRVQFAPTRGRSKVYIIDEVHMLSVAAFNALLKTLEEPPSHVVFVLCTTDPQKVPETIHSRCQRFDFRRIAAESMVSRLGAICMAEGVEFEGEALDLIAHRAEGGLRNALTSLEQIIAFENGKVTLAGAERLLGSIDSSDLAELVAYVGRRDIANCFRWTASYVETGADLAQFVRDMAEHVRNLYVMALVGDEADLDISETTRHELAQELQWYGPDRLARLLGVLGDLSSELKTSSNPRLAFEIALTRMVRPDSDLTLESLAERIEALEGGYSAVAHVMPGAPLGRSVSASSANAPAEEAWQQPAQAASPVGSALPEGLPAMEPAPGVAAAPADRGMAADAQSAQPAQAALVAGGAWDRGTASVAAQAQTAPGAQATQATQVTQAAQATSGTQATQAAQPSGAAGGGQLDMLANPATLQRIWQAALSGVKKQKQAYGVLFMNAKAHYDAASRLVKVSFPEEATFAFNAVQKPEVQDALAASLEKAVGQAVPFALERAGQTLQPAPAAAPNTAASDDRPAAAAQTAQQAQPAQQVQAAQEAQFAQHEHPHAEPSAQQAQQPASQAQPSIQEEVPYEAVPYEELGSFDEYGMQPAEAAFDAPRFTEPKHAAPFAEEAPRPAEPSPQPAVDSATSASPEMEHLSPTGALVEDPSDVEALLQAGFGGGVVFSEVQE